MEFTRGSDDTECASVSAPLPLDDDEQLTSCSRGSSAEAEGRRLWIGNLDFNLTEFSLLKLVERHGPLEKFDFMYHLGPGSSMGKPRGYCFVTYLNSQDAQQALNSLDGKMVLARKLVVRFANADRKSQAASIVPSDGATSAQPDPFEREALRRKKIAAIEEQLRKMSADQTSSNGRRAQIHRSSQRTKSEPYHKLRHA